MPLIQYQRLAQPLEPSLTTAQDLSWIVQHPGPVPPSRLRQSEWFTASPIGSYSAVDYGPMEWHVQHPIAPPPPRLRQSEWLAPRPLEPSLVVAPPELSWVGCYPDYVVRRKHQTLPGGMAPSNLDESLFVVTVVPDFFSLVPGVPVRRRDHYWYTQQASHLDFMWVGQACGMAVALMNPGDCSIALLNPGDCSIALANPGSMTISLAVCG